MGERQWQEVTHPVPTKADNLRDDQWQEDTLSFQGGLVGWGAFSHSSKQTVPMKRMNRLPCCLVPLADLCELGGAV